MLAPVTIKEFALLKFHHVLPTFAVACLGKFCVSRCAHFFSCFSDTPQRKNEDMPLIHIAEF